MRLWAGRHKAGARAREAELVGFARKIGRFSPAQNQSLIEAGADRNFASGAQENALAGQVQIGKQVGPDNSAR